MSTTPAPSASDAGLLVRVVPFVPLGIGLLALLNLGPAIWIAVAPYSFFHQIGPFGVYNGHFLGDAAAFEGGIGLALAAAVRWPALRAGTLAAALGATALHALNHWIDVNHAHAGSNAGITDAVSLTLLAAFTAVLLAAVMRERTS